MSWGFRMRKQLKFVVSTKTWVCDSVTLNLKRLSHPVIITYYFIDP